MSIKAPNTDPPGEGFNSIENTRNGLKGWQEEWQGRHAENTEWRHEEHRSHGAS